jgi:hypothetical protein
MIAQIDEQQIAMVALAMDPTGKPRRRSGVLAAQLTAGMRSIGMHDVVLKSRFAVRPAESGKRAM